MESAKCYLDEEDVDQATEDEREATASRGPQEMMKLAELTRWAFGVVKNTIRNHQRALRREQARYAPVEEALELPSPGPTPYEHLAARELEQAIARACARMTARQRAIIGLLRDGATNEEIMVELKLSTPEKTRKKVREARERLRKLLEAEGYRIRR